MRTEIKDNLVHIYLKSNKFMRLVRVESDMNTFPFSDNYFDLLPNEETCITQSIPDGIDINQYLSGLSVRCVQDIEPKGSRLGDKLMRLKVLLSPVNFASYIYDSRIPKDLSIK